MKFLRTIVLGIEGEADDQSFVGFSTPTTAYDNRHGHFHTGHTYSHIHARRARAIAGHVDTDFVERSVNEAINQV